jgi:uncharacterized protein YyaL (SSP411 family)
VNRLANATSPYLLQHAENPVDWYPWADEAFEAARTRDVPVFLSVGYAACHWCHVMERESFEDPGTAAFLNEHFVAIKVDREERPDVDTIYMDAVQAMTGSGGWPMSVFCTPDGRPFYAGTYFPDTPRHGLPSFRQLLEGIADLWTSRRADAEEQSARFTDAISRATATGAGAAIADDAIAERAFVALERSADRTWGGFGGAPKFPQPMVLTWLLRQHLHGRDGALDVATITLDRMAAGGMHDQVGGGFARYSTDARWHVPHFEKMLTDNALLLQLYTNAWLVTRTPRYRSVAIRTAEYLLDVLRRPEGGFASSQDADTDAVEGATYVWAWEELVGLVGAEVADAFGAKPEGNWEGTNVLWFPEDVERVAERHGADIATFTAAVDAAREPLRERRRHREQPGIDDKVVAGWNGLAIGALAIAGRVLGMPAFVEAAAACATFVWTSMRDERGQLVRAWRDAAGGYAFLDDYALLADGMLTLFETTGDADWFERAATLVDTIQQRFTDPSGGFFLTPDDGEALITRPKDVIDTATPSGTSAAAHVLLRIARYRGEDATEQVARDTLAPILASAATHPAAFGHALCVADMLNSPPLEIAIIGDRTAAETHTLTDVIFADRYLPNAVVALRDPADEGSARVPLLNGRQTLAGAPTAYVCERFACQMPTSNPEVLVRQLPS